MYIPDWNFVRKLKSYDRKLGVHWDARKQRWAITRLVPDSTSVSEQPKVLFYVQNTDKSFRPLDDRVLYMLRKGDHHNRGRRAVIEEMINAQKRQQQIHNKDRKNQMEALASDVTPLGGYDDPSLGSRNIPKEDIQSVEQYIEEREIQAEFEESVELAA